MTTFRLIRTDRNADASAWAGESMLIGRARASDVQLGHPSVAAAHAGIKWHDGAFWLSALGAAPVLLNGESVRHARLGAAAIVRIGAYLLRLAAQDETLQVTVEFALGLALAELEATEPPSVAGTAEDQESLERYWAKRAAPDLSPSDVPLRGEVPRRGPLRLALLGVGLFLLCAVLVAWAFPRVYAPGPLAAAHTRQTLTTTTANKPVAACANCHTLTGTMQQQCAACHTTPDFQSDIAQKHVSQGVACRVCHGEHRVNLIAREAIIPNQLCLTCHQAPLHGAAVAYPVRSGLWSWAGLSQTAWQTHGLPGRTSDYNLREQFHMLHAQGKPQGRTQCADCHLGGTEGAALKQNVREACAQCHAVQPSLAAELARLAETQPLKEGHTRCVSCHAQHGAEKDLRASVRK